MNWLIISALIAVTLPFYKFFNYKPEERYKQWYVPIVMLIEALVAVHYYKKYVLGLTDAIANANMPKLLPYVDYVYVMICMSAMLLTKRILKGIKLYEKIDKLFPGILTKAGKYNDRFSYFPYVKQPMGTRPGVAFLSAFYKYSILACLLLIAFSIFFGMDIELYMKSGLFAFSLPIITELYNFYNTSLVHGEQLEVEAIPEASTTEIPKLDALWSEYVKHFGPSFCAAVAVHGDAKPGNAAMQNGYAFATILDEFKAGKDLIVADLDIPNSFHNFSDIFFNSLSSGGNILILADIPTGRHNLKAHGKDISMMELFASYLSSYLQQKASASEILKPHYLPIKSSEDQFKSRIILASVSTILESDILNIKWFENLDLLMVVNLSDHGRINFFEHQKFNLLMDQAGRRIQTVILSAFRQGLQASLTKVWRLDRTCEKRFVPEIRSYNRYCIITNFDKWHENWLKIATPVGTNIYSGVELAVPAISYGLNVTFLDIASAEVREGREALDTSRGHITKYDLGKCDLYKQTEMNLLPFYMFDNRKQHFSIIYDIENNAPEMYNKWMHLGSEDNFSIVVSKPYLFKDYFADNIMLFQHSPMQAIEPVPSLSKVNLTILLYNILTEGKVSEGQLKKILADYNIPLYNQPIPVILRWLFIRYFNFDIEENSRLQVEEEVLFSKDGFQKSYIYSLAPFKIDHFPQFAPLRMVKILDNRGILRFTIYKDMLFQNYMVGQKHVFNGRTFEISSYDDSEAIMVIRNLPQFNNHLFYKSCFKVTHDVEAFEGMVDDRVSLKSLASEFSLVQFEASLTLETLAYFEFCNSYQAITENNLQDVLRVDLLPAEQAMVKRKYRNSRVLKLEWKLDKVFTAEIPKLQASIHLLLYEVFRSFFPYSNQYLLVCSNANGLSSKELAQRAKLAWIFPEFSNAASESCIELFIFEDSISDIGILNAIRENYVYIFKYMYDYLCWLQEPATATKTAGKYINNIKDKQDFLKYGMGAVPDFLDLKLLKDFADKHFPLDRMTRLELKNARASMALKP